MLATPRNEFPEFPAALSFVMLLGPGRGGGRAGRRADVLREQLAALDSELAGALAGLPRVALLETEYQRAIIAAELELGGRGRRRPGRRALTWSHEELAEIARASRGD